MGSSLYINVVPLTVYDVNPRRTVPPPIHPEINEESLGLLVVGGRPTAQKRSGSGSHTSKESKIKFSSWVVLLGRDHGGVEVRVVWEEVTD